MASPKREILKQWEELPGHRDAQGFARMADAGFDTPLGREASRAGNPRQYPGPPGRGSGMTINPQWGKVRGKG